jgi:hypothetical protein
MGSGPDTAYAVYNLTRDNITEWTGETPEWQYVPEDPYEWLDAAWPNGYN